MLTYTVYCDRSTQFAIATGTYTFDVEYDGFIGEMLVGFNRTEAKAEFRAEFPALSIFESLSDTVGANPPS